MEDDNSLEVSIRDEDKLDSFYRNLYKSALDRDIIEEVRTVCIFLKRCAEIMRWRIKKSL